MRGDHSKAASRRSGWKLRALSCFFPLIALGIAGAEARERFLGIERHRIEEIIELGYSLSDDTPAAIEALRADFPESPVPDLLEVGRLYWYQNYAEWDEQMTAAFKEAADASLEKAKRFASGRKDDPEAELTVALHEVIYLMHFVDERRWWAALWKARSSFKSLRRILEEDPELHDAKLPLGIAYCYSESTPAYLKPLSFLLRFKGDIDKGLNYIQDAKDQGLFLRIDATYHLGMVERELKEDLEAAEAAFGALVERFPSNGRFQNMLAQVERASGEEGGAVARLTRLLETSGIERYPGVWVRSLSSLCWSALAAGRFELALDTAREAERIILADERIPDELGWARMAQGEALRGLDRQEEAVERFKAVPRSSEHYHRAAQERIGDIERTAAARDSAHREARGL